MACSVGQSASLPSGLDTTTSADYARIGSSSAFQKQGPRSIDAAANKRIAWKAFLAPSLVGAAIDRRLPDGLGVTRLCDLPPDWAHQYRMLGLHPPDSFNK
jgi:hypothetical protein